MVSSCSEEEAPHILTASDCRRSESLAALLLQNPLSIAPLLLSLIPLGWWKYLQDLSWKLCPRPYQRGAGAGPPWLLPSWRWCYSGDGTTWTRKRIGGIDHIRGNPLTHPLRNPSSSLMTSPVLLPYRRQRGHGREGDTPLTAPRCPCLAVAVPYPSPCRPGS